MAQQGETIDPAVLDDIIGRLLEFRQARSSRQVQLMESEIRQLCAVSREIFLQQPNLLELEAPIKICGVFSLTQIVRFSMIFVLKMLLINVSTVIASVKLFLLIFITIMIFLIWDICDFIAE